MKQAITIFCAVVLSLPLAAQKADLSTMDGIVSTLYGVISGPAGERDWDTFRSLFTENAIMGAMSLTPEGDGYVYRNMTPDSYIANNGAFFKDNGFWETEIGRQVHQFGELAHVFTAYQFIVGDEEHGEVARRGINSVQMVYQQDRWWIVSIQWNAEREDLKLPNDLLHN